MIRLQFAVIGWWLVSAYGCGGATPPGQPVEGGGEGTQPARIAGGPSEGPMVDQGPRPAPDAAPPYVFQPRSHPPIARYADRPIADLAALPKLKMRLNQCFPTKKEKLPPPIASVPGIAVGSTGFGNISRMGTAGPTQKSPARRSKAASKPPQKAADKAKRESRSDDRDRRAESPMPRQMPAAESSRAPSPSKDEDYAAQAAEGYDGDAEEAAEAEAPAPSEDPGARYAPAYKKKIAGDVPPPPPAPREPEPNIYDQYQDWGQAIYLSNDDTMSLSSAQRVIYAIDHFLPLPLEQIRPHELLNYFSFDTAQVLPGNDFSVMGEIDADAREPGIYTLGLTVNGRPVDKAARRNAAITLVIDRSGSMADEGRMSYLKQGLTRMLSELKRGDMVHIVLFDHQICVPTENFVVGRDDIGQLEKVIKALKPRGNTDLQRGLSEAYDIADRAYRPDYSNRVILITDALTNTGVTDENMISMISRYYDTRRIRLSGVGVGREFNDALLDRLTERGKGAYVFLGSEAEVDALFGAHFISLIETTALDVHFRLHLPPSLRMNVFYGEESSTQKADVQEIHYFANTSQLFLSDLMARGGKLRREDGVMLRIEYSDPETGEPLFEEYAFTLADLARQSRNVKKARAIMAWIDMLAEMARRPLYAYQGGVAGSWRDAEGWQRCDEGMTELNRLTADLAGDPEVGRVKELFIKYCARYERPRNPVRRDIPSQQQAWPSAR